MAQAHHDLTRSDFLSPDKKLRADGKTCGPHVVVVGSGLAGLTAALQLAESGLEVTVLEAHPRYLGGRTCERESYSFEHAGQLHTHSSDHGQHCLWHQYHNMRHLLRRLGIWDRWVVPGERAQYIVDDGATVHALQPFDVHPGRAQPSLLHFYWDLLRASRAPGWRTTDTIRLLRSLPRLGATLAFRHARDYDQWDRMSIHEMFAWMGMPEQLSHMMKSMCKASTFNAHTEISAAWALSMIETTLVADPADHTMWCFRGNLGQALVDPLEAELVRLGVRIRRGARAVDIERHGNRIAAVGVKTDAGQERVPCDWLVCAADIPGAQRLLLPELGDRSDYRRMANLEAISSVCTRVILSRPLATGSDVWMGIFSGKFRYLDAYFVLSRYQDEFADWSRRFGGDVVELHCYVAHRELNHMPATSVPDVLLAELYRAWPSLRGHVVHVHHHVNPPTFDKQTVGHARHNPPIQGSIDNLLMCGSWVNLEQPVHDMEKAVTTGLLAANAILRAEKVRQAPVIQTRTRSLPQRALGQISRLLPAPPAVRRRTSTAWY
jgi:isorenieratene synthase